MIYRDWPTKFILLALVGFVLVGSFAQAASDALGDLPKAVADFDGATSIDSKIRNAYIVTQKFNEILSKRNLDLNLAKEAKVKAHPADSFLESLARELQRFEEQLKPEDVQGIMKEHPESYLYQVKKIFSLASQNKCLEQDYAKLKEKIGAENLVRRGMYLNFLALLYQTKYSKILEKEILVYSKSHPLLGSKPELEAFLKFSQELDDKSKSGMSLLSRIQENEKILARTGISGERVYQYVIDATLIAPSCLYVLSPSYMNFLKVDETVVRGQYLLKKIETYVGEKKALPKGYVIGLAVADGDFLFGTKKDAWNRDYVFKKEGTLLHMESQGAEPGKSKPIVIGSIDLKGSLY